MASATLLTGGSVPKGLENPIKERKAIRITGTVRKNVINISHVREKYFSS
jgi:hypothetical protein